MTTMYVEDQSWVRRVAAMDEFALDVPAELREVVKAMAALDALPRKLDVAQAVVDSEITATNVAQRRHDTALLIAAEDKVEKANEALRLRLIGAAHAAMKPHTQRLSAQLAHVFATQTIDVAPFGQMTRGALFVRCAELFNHADPPHKLFEAGGETTTLAHALRATVGECDIRFNALRAHLGYVGGVEALTGRDRLYWWLADDDQLSADEYELINSTSAQGFPLLQLASERGHAIALQSISDTTKNVRAASARQKLINDQRAEDAKRFGGFARR